MKSLIEKKAHSFCEKNKHRLTEPRIEVLQIIVSSEKPIKAYEILEKLKNKLDNPKPPTIYRAIEFWQRHNFIHRIESLNAYSACVAQHIHEGSQFMICDQCGKVIESHFCDLPNVIEKFIKEKTFKLNKWNLEINGICKECS